MANKDTGQIAPRSQALQEIRHLLGREAKTVEAVLGRYMPVERFLGAIVTLCYHNPDLLDVNRDSLKLAVLRCAQLQLSPEPLLGLVWIIPRKGRAEIQLGWKGCLALAYRSPLVGAVRYGVVGQQDHFVWRDGRKWMLEHEPTEEGWPTRTDDIRAAWAIIDLRTGHSIPRVMYRAEILRHKARGAGAQPAWATDPAPMSVKTVIADACRRGPFEGELGRAFALDYQGEIGLGQPADEPPAIEVTPVPPAEAASSPLLDKLKAAHGLTPATVPEDAERELGEDSFDDDDEPPLPEPPWDEMNQHESFAVMFMRREQVERIRDLSVEKGLSEVELEARIGGRPEDQPAQDETRILAILRDLPSPKKGKR